MTLTITRSWRTLPILVTPLALIAWQYRYRDVVVFIKLGISDRTQAAILALRFGLVDA